MPDAELVQRALDLSGLSLRQFAREVLHGLRTEGAIRHWLRGSRALSDGARDILEQYVAEHG